MISSLAFSQLQWDPVSIICQIAVIQCCYYMVLGLLVVITDAIFDCLASLQVDQLFDPLIITFGTALGRASIIAFVLNSLIMCVVKVPSLGKSKPRTTNPPISTHIRLHNTGSELSNLKTSRNGLILVKVVGRAKRVLDFSATSFVVHLGLVLLFAGFPVSWKWWLLQIVCVTLQTLLAEFICIRKEMKEISPQGSAATVV